MPVRADGKTENVLAHAAAVARRFRAQILALHCRPRPEDLLPFGVPVGGAFRDQILASAASLADAEEAALRASFDAAAARLGLASGPSPDGPEVLWREVPGRQVDVIKTHGRLADLIVVAKPDVDRNLGTNTLKAALFHTGRPVLMCPPRTEPPALLGERIAIGWNGSTQAARAVALTLGLIQAAREVTVLTSGIEVHGASAADLCEYLAVRGVTARLQEFPAGGRDGRRLSEAADAWSADLLVMGGYGRSHESETIFGGTTQWIVDHSERPVVLVH
jgi:nucleotide-binding universal stress UspA family protein